VSDQASSHSTTSLEAWMSIGWGVSECAAGITLPLYQV
jgi:hypothetical protein